MVQCTRRAESYNWQLQTNRLTQTQFVGIDTRSEETGDNYLDTASQGDNV